MDSAPRREGWLGVIVGLILLAAACIWWIIGMREAESFGRQHPDAMYDNPIPLIFTAFFGWFGLVVLGVALLRRRHRAWKALGAVCIAAALAPLGYAVWLTSTS
jgi:hypothetical protein